MRMKKIISILLVNSMIVCFTNGMVDSVKVKALSKSLSMSNRTQIEMQEVKGNAEDLLGEEFVDSLQENILVYDEEGHILNEIHTDGTIIEYDWDGEQISTLVNSNGFKCTYTTEKNGEITEHSYFDNEKLYDKVLRSEDNFGDFTMKNVSVKQKFKSKFNELYC